MIFWDTLESCFVCLGEDETLLLRLLGALREIEECEEEVLDAADDWELLDSPAKNVNKINFIHNIKYLISRKLNNYK